MQQLLGHGFQLICATLCRGLLGEERNVHYILARNSQHENDLTFTCVKIDIIFSESQFHSHPYIAISLFLKHAHIHANASTSAATLSDLFTNLKPLNLEQGILNIFFLPLNNSVIVSKDQKQKFILYYYYNYNQ